MRILLMLAVLFPSIALAQAGPDIYKPARASQVMPYSGTAATITDHILNRVVRLVCTTDCFIAFLPSGHTVPVTTSTGVFLPSGVPETFIVNPNTKISVIRDTTNGKLHVQELSR